MILDSSRRPNPISGRVLALARTGWLILALFTVGLFMAAIPARYLQLVTVSPEAATTVGQLQPAEAEALARLGFTVAGYAAYFTTIEAVVGLFFFAVAALIFVVCSQDSLPLLASATLVLLGFTSPVVTALDVNGSAWHEPILALRAAMVGSLPLLLFLFPDGRFVPRSTRWLALAWLAYALSVLAWPALQAPVSFGRLLRPVDVPLIIWDVAWFGTGVLSQVYRYQRVATPSQRQQTKWVVFGFAVFIAALCVGLVLLISAPFDPRAPFSVFAHLAGPTLLLAGALAIPLTIGVSILRFRLWEIDLIIRRTLVYAALTALLALAYFSSVVVLQNTFGALTGQRQSTLVTVLSTLVIAALFVPLRRRVQAVIDRRFYRRNYDAARVLETFGTMVRDEVDLAVLIDRLEGVLDQTMQPLHVSVWLRDSNAQKKR